MGWTLGAQNPPAFGPWGFDPPPGTNLTVGRYAQGYGLCSRALHCGIHQLKKIWQYGLLEPCADLNVFQEAGEDGRAVGLDRGGDHHAL